MLQSTIHYISHSASIVLNVYAQTIGVGQRALHSIA
jgi:hypothetical protein